MSQPGFFEFREKIVKAGKRHREQSTAESPPARGGGDEPALTVSQLTARIDAALRTGLPPTVTVRGELSNFSHHRASGHFYFTLKDSAACLDCVMFRNDAARVPFAPQDGMELLATGAVRVYAQRGRYQLYVSTLSPIGQGALELALRQLRERLERLGLFDAERKRVLPRYPLRVAVITGRDTAALQDILKVFARYPFVTIGLFDVPVQGDGAAARIAAALQAVGRTKTAADRFDVALLARGGGSLEDLWAFNEEAVVRAVAACPVPVVSGIGHEVDVSLADLAADYHAHTPTEAAQVVVAQWRAAPAALEALRARLARCARLLITDRQQQLCGIALHEFFRRPTDLVDERRQWLDDRQRAIAQALARRVVDARRTLDRNATALARHHPGHAVRLAASSLTHRASGLRSAIARVVRERRDRLASLERALCAVSPAATLARGYSITSHKVGGKIIRSAAEVSAGDVLLTRFADGEVESTVRDRRQLQLFEE